MELYVEPVRLKYNPLTGHFLKGHVPHNKGKKWGDYLDMRKARKVIRIGSKNLHGRLDIGGQNKRKVIGLMDGKIVGCYESATMAANRLKIQRRNISHCCEGKRNKCGGIRWFFESDYDKWIIYLQL